MDMWKLILGILLATLAGTQILFARGGGGCVEQGTLISTPTGMVAVEELRPGDRVWSVQHGRLAAGTVQALIQVQPGEYIELDTGHQVLHVTAEHPIQTDTGTFIQAGQLRVGMTAWTWRNGEADVLAMQSVRRVPAARPAYNLLVMPGGTFIAGSVVVHNKGCFLPDTPILKPDGTASPIRSVRSGDNVMAFDPDGTIVVAKVQAVITHEVDEYYIVKTDRVELHVTAEHPFYVGDGRFKTLEALHVGDSIYALDGSTMSPQSIVGMQRREEHVRVYNLQTEEPHTYFAAGIAVHNKGGGCFVAGTQICTANRSVAIETLKIGDRVLGMDEHGQVSMTSLQAIHAQRSATLEVQTDLGRVITTREHPMRLAAGGFCEAGALTPGQQLTWCDGGRLKPATIGTLRPGPETTVYNLTVGEPHTFIADGFVVHNKGGGGYHGSSHGSRSSSTQPFSENIVPLLIFGGVFGTLFVAMIWKGLKGRSGGGELDFCYSVSAVAPKAGKTLRLLEYLARKDTSVDPRRLEQAAQATFKELQKCWQSRDYGPMKPLMMPHLYVEHMGQIAAMIQQHEINVIEGLIVHGVDLVGVHYTREPEQRNFTALITAAARDYYIDDRNQKFLRGDQSSARFQEFWTFQFQAGHWLLREIEQTRESGVLKEENIVETVSPEQLRQVYGADARAAGPAGPARETEVDLRVTRVDEMLEAISRRDPLWTRQDMILRVREVFMDTMLAQQQGESQPLPEAELFPQVAEALRQEMQQRQQQGVRVEYRNLCLRNVDLILIRNRIDDSQDEFTARISAHALKVRWKGSNVVDEQPYVTPFITFWTFGRRDNQWCLKEILPAAGGQATMRQQNVDESGPYGVL